jgi:hypothetical protein
MKARLPANIELLLKRLLEVDGPTSVAIPYTLHGQEHLFEVSFEAGHVEVILSEVKRACNTQALALGHPAPFPNPADFPDPDEELRRRSRRLAGEILLELEAEGDIEMRMKGLAQVERLLRTLRPAVSMKQTEWEKLVKAFRKLNPQMTEDDILSLL